MTSPPVSISFAFSQSMRELDRAAWDALALPRPSPFLEWDWLDLLERSGSVGPEKGWLPLHLTASSGGQVVAAAPLYLKNHSQGEFVFDHVFADAAKSLGESYYPKLVAASPFTPATGYEFLTSPDLDPDLACRVVAEGMDRLCRSGGLSGAHVLFAAPKLAERLARFGFQAWAHQGFIWENKGYCDFDDFLGAMRAPRRKAVRREREELRRSGVTVRLYCGDEIPDRFFPLMYALYERTNDKFGRYSCKYLTPTFFEGLSGALRRRILFTAAFLPGCDEPMAMAMFVRKNELLFGRYWGSFKDVPCLHFELCYYAPIAWAIENGLQRFDPGMGGEHKARRGFVSRPAYSLHRFAIPGVSALFARHIEEINRLEEEYVEEMNALSPFRRG